jgi:hypothetical protein
MVVLICVLWGVSLSDPTSPEEAIARAPRALRLLRGISDVKVMTQLYCHYKYPSSSLDVREDNHSLVLDHKATLPQEPRAEVLYLDFEGTPQSHREP